MPAYGPWQREADLWLETSFRTRAFKAARTVGPIEASWPAMLSEERWADARNFPPPVSEDGTIRAAYWQPSRPLDSYWEYSGRALFYAPGDYEAAGYEWETDGPVLNGFLPNPYPSPSPSWESWPEGVAGVEVGTDGVLLDRRLLVAVTGEGHVNNYPLFDPVALSGGVSVLDATKVDRNGPFHPMTPEYGPSTVLREESFSPSYILSAPTQTATFVPGGGGAAFTFGLPVDAVDDIIAVAPVLTAWSGAEPVGYELTVQIAQITCDTLVRPPSWRYIYRPSYTIQAGSGLGAGVFYEGGRYGL